MKTKHLLTALALPAIFAACTADDIVTENANQAQRVALNENFKMNFGGVESRLSAGEPGAAISYGFETGDMVGSAIIDQYVPGANKTLDQKYQVVEWASTNQPWTFDGSEWTINHTMVEGKYLFYYPYNENNNSRGPVQYSLPVMQDLSDKTTGEFNPKAAIEKYGMSIGYQFITKDDLTASSEMYPLFAYARIIGQVDNAYAGGEIEKVVLQTSSATPFKLAGQLNHKAIETIFKASKTVKDFKWSSYNKTEQFALASTNAYYDAEQNVTSAVMVAKFPAGVSMTSDAQGIKSFETYMVVPAQNVSSLTAYVYMTDGRVFTGSIAGNTEFKCNVSKKLTFGLIPAASGANEIIAAQKDWNEAVNKMSKNTTFIIADPNFTVTNDMKYSEDYKITINGNVNVSGNDVTMQNVEATTITVLEGAKLNADVTVKANIINEGEVVVAANPESRAAIEAYQIAAIENAGTLTVEKNAVIATALTNKKGATVVNAGEMTISGSNNGTIENAGTIYVNGSNFVNDEVEFEVEDNEEVILNTPTINNAATGKFRADGVFTNKAKFVNEGILSCKNNAGSIVNSLTSDNGTGFKAAGEIDAKNGSTTYITTNDAKVVVYAMKQANMTINGGDGSVEYTATNATETVDESIVTDIIATKDLEIKWSNKDKGYAFANLTVNNAAKVKLTAPANKSLSVATMNVKGNATIASNFTVTTLNVAEGAIINVPAEYALTVSTIDNKGTISVVGTLNATAYAGTEEAVGDVEDNGKGTINWKPSAAQQNLTTKKAAYETAMKAALAKWADSTVGGAGTYNFGQFNYNLNDTVSVKTLGGAEYVGTAKVFAKWAELSSSITEAATVTAAHTAYVNAYKVVNPTATKTPEFLEYYAGAVSAYITTLKAKDDYKADMKVFKEIKVDAADDASVFVDIKDVLCTDGTTKKTITAEEQALARFKEYITLKNHGLCKNSLVVLCSETSYSNVETYVPDYTFVFASSNVYKLMSDYIKKYEIADATGLTTLEKVQNYVKDYANTTEKLQASWTVGQKKLYNFIVAEDFKVYDESLEWAYSDKTIEAIFNN